MTQVLKHDNNKQNSQHRKIIFKKHLQPFILTSIQTFEKKITGFTNQKYKNFLLVLMALKNLPKI